MYIFELSHGVTEPPVLSLVLLVSPVPGSSARPPEAPGSSMPHLRQQQHPTPPTSPAFLLASDLLTHWLLVGFAGGTPWFMLLTFLFLFFSASHSWWTASCTILAIFPFPLPSLSQSDNSDSFPSLMFLCLSSQPSCCLLHPAICNLSVRPSHNWNRCSTHQILLNSRCH